MKPTVLIVDDEPLFLKSLGRVLKGEGYEVTLSHDGRSAIEQFEKTMPNIILLDLALPDMNGLRLLKELKRLEEEAVFIMMTGQGGVKEAVEAIKLGAMDYLSKPLDMEELKAVMERLTEVWKLKFEAREFYLHQKDRFSFGKIIRRGKKMEAVCRLAERIASSGSSTVLIQGESGTGKGLIASAIHYNSPRKDGPFVTVNCAVLMEGLLESELFGHEKGAFTGAVRRKTGKFALANKGTIFLDEIGEITPALQAKLLRVIEEREFERLGGDTVIKADVRLIAATNKDLVMAVKNGSFREDLFYRLNVLPLHLPPLRERREDIPLLAMHFLNEFNNEFGRKVKAFSEETLGFMKRHSWRGNVRELRNFVERAVLLARGDIIQMDAEDLKHAVSLKEKGVFIPDDLPILPLNEMISVYVKSVLEKMDGNKSRAAELLDITRQRLRRVLEP